VARGNRSFENYFVNGRYVKSKVIAKAIEDAYHGFLMQHKYPFTLLYLDIACDKVDVNVHPQKLEVRISDQEGVYHRLCLTIQNALMQRERIPEVPIGKEKTAPQDAVGRLPRLPKGAPEPFERAHRASADSSYSSGQTGKTSLSSLSAVIPEIPGTPLDALRRIHSDTPEPEASAARTLPPAVPDTDAPAVSVSEEENRTDAPGADGRKTEDFLKEESSVYAPSQTESDGEGFYRNAADKETQNSGSAIRPEEKEKVPQEGKTGKEPKAEQLNLFTEDKVLSEQARQMFRLIGQVFDTYWMIEYKDSLYIIDQHAAHEKVNYERMMKAYREKTIHSQMLYPSIVLDLSRREAQLLESNLKAFEDLGFEVESFGGNSFKINAVPANLYSVASDELFMQILAELESLGEVSPKLIPEKLASMSCKAAVKGNNRLSVEEANALIDELLTLENPYNCPHGRPTIISMTRYEMDKKFKRIV
jgi:DNA mismatch repair protein MutL